jgi:hypothetical protein
MRLIEAIVIDLFYPAKIIPVPTRAVRLSGEPDPGEGRPYVPRPIKKERPAVDAKRARIRARQAQWLREKRRKDKKYREAINRRERERYAAMTPEQKAAILERNKIRKQQMRGTYHGD